MFKISLFNCSIPLAWFWIVFILIINYIFSLNIIKNLFNRIISKWSAVIIGPLNIVKGNKYQSLTKSVFSIYKYVFILLLIILTILNMFGVNIFIYEGLEAYNCLNDNLNMSSDSTSTNNSSTKPSINPTVNVKDNKVENVNVSSMNVSVPVHGLNSIAAAASSAAGITAGIKVAQQVGGPPLAKVAAGIATYGVVQAGTTIVKHVLNNTKV